MPKVMTSFRLSERTVEELDRNGRRLGGLSRTTMIELLSRLYADQIPEDVQVPLDLLQDVRRVNKGAANTQAKKKPRKRHDKI